MSRFLFATWHGGGNAAPVLALAKRLGRRGHAVRVLLPATMSEHTSGEYDVVSGDGMPAWQPRRGLLIQEQVQELRRYLCGPAWRDAVATELARRPADVFVCDKQLPSASVAAEARNTPTALLVTTLFNAWFHWWGTLAFDGETTRDLVARAALTLAVTPPELDFDVDAEQPPNVRYTGPVSDPDPFAPFESPWPAGNDDPLVVISFSTIYQRQEVALAEVVEAVADLSVRALLLAGEGLDVPTPRHVEVRRWVPHSSVMPLASLCVTHGGCGTTMSALASGVPLLVLPHTWEQAANGQRASDLGAGKLISADAPAAEIAGSIVELLGDPTYAECAARTSSWFEDGSDRAVGALEDLAARA